MSNIPSLEQVKAMLQSTASTTLKNAPVQSVNGQKGDINIPPAPVQSVNGNTGDVTIRELPKVSTAYNGYFLRVVSGEWAAQKIANAEGVSF